VSAVPGIVYAGAFQIRNQVTFKVGFCHEDQGKLCGSIVPVQYSKSAAVSSEVNAGNKGIALVPAAA
jgi:hypothetical protein